MNKSLIAFGNLNNNWPKIIRHNREPRLIFCYIEFPKVIEVEKPICQHPYRFSHSPQPHPHPGGRWQERWATTPHNRINNTRRHHTALPIVVSVVTATGKRPAPSRTRKLSLTAPMVLHPPGCGRVGHHRAHTTQLARNRYMRFRANCLSGCR